MKILVPVKWVVDYNVKVRVKDDGSGVEVNNVKMAMNPFDEISVEEAIRLKEAGHAQEIVVVTIGSDEANGCLRTALAMGADRAIHVKTETLVEPLAVAKILKSIAQEEDAKLIILGKQAIDDDCNQTAQMLSALMGCSQATYVNNVEFLQDALKITREIDGGLQTIQVSLPAILSTDLRLNEPRYASLPNIMKAKRKPLEEKTPQDYDVDVTPRLTILNTVEPSQRKSGVIVKSVDELLEKLRDVENVI